MNDKHNTFTFCENDYSQYGHDGTKEMYADIGEFIRIAVKNGYKMAIWYDGMTVGVEYNYQDESLSGVSLEWIGDDEYVARYDDSPGEDE